MKAVIKKDVLDVLEKTVKLIHDEDAAGLGELSNHVIHDASVFQDADSVSVAVLVYAISKIMGRCFEEHEDPHHVCAVIVPQLKKAIGFLEKNKTKQYREVIKRVLEKVGRVDEKLRLYVQTVFDRARIKKASKVYEHGISLARTAYLLNISQWELMNYVGKTKIPEMPAEIPVRQRLSFARGLFR